MGYGQYSDGSRGRTNPLRGDAVKARRQVYPTDEVPHKWANQTQDAARNPQGNLYFRGPVIYSYRDSWPLARIYERPIRGEPSTPERLVLTNSRRYSVTTTAHQSAVNRAASHLPQIAVPAPTPDYGDALQHGENLRHLAATAAEHLAKAGRVMSVNSAEWEIRHARETIADAGRYMDFFKIRGRRPTFDEKAAAAALERARRIENPDPASLDKRERQRAARLARAQEAQRRREEGRAIELAAARSAWRLGGAWGMRATRLDGPVMLRVNGDQIETSQGARVPLAAAPMVWQAVSLARRHGGFTKVRGLARIGYYPLDRIDADGTLHAGCHVIPYSELAAMARRLGLER